MTPNRGASADWQSHGQCDEKLGFNKVAKYYYYPGWDCTGQFAFYVGLRCQRISSERFRPQLHKAPGTCSSNNRLRRLIAGGTELRPISREIMKGGYCVAFALYAEETEMNPEPTLNHDTAGA